MILGIIGGTGIDESIIEVNKKHELSTPYGKPSGEILEGRVNGVDTFFILRHGKGHAINPSKVPYRANIHALKELGVTHIIAPCAVGSLKEEVKPGELVFTDQFIDKTSLRSETFYDKDKVMHIPMAIPFCPEMRKVLAEGAKELDIPHHRKGTNVVMEGPRFSTRAESMANRLLGADTINMTMVPECVLAREKGMHYAAIAMVTDYDCWRETIVDVEEILTTVRENADKVKRLLTHVAPKLDTKEACPCPNDWKFATL
ncbi:MAG: S-methyl-5'-thioadenosine phosphorylase [Nanoarchaeota archaeon]